MLRWRISRIHFTKWLGRINSYFACTVNEYAGNRTDRKFDTRLRFSDETVPNTTEVCYSDTKWM